MDRKCQVCLEGDDARKGDVEIYRRGPESGDYHQSCALQVGYNEWEADLGCDEHGCYCGKGKDCEWLKRRST